MSIVDRLVAWCQSQGIQFMGYDPKLPGTSIRGYIVRTNPVLVTLNMAANNVVIALQKGLRNKEAYVLAHEVGHYMLHCLEVRRCAKDNLVDAVHEALADAVAYSILGETPSVAWAKGKARNRLLTTSEVDRRCYGMLLRILASRQYRNLLDVVYGVVDIDDIG